MTVTRPSRYLAKDAAGLRLFIELVDAELREAGGDPEAIGKRGAGRKVAHQAQDWHVMTVGKLTAVPAGAVLAEILPFVPKFSNKGNTEVRQETQRSAA